MTSVYIFKRNRIKRKWREVAIYAQPDFKAPCEAKQQAGLQFSGGIQID